MIRSMTGYGTASHETATLSATATVKSVNHRFLDAAVHLPRRLSALESEVKRAVQQRVARGRVEISVHAVIKDEPGTVAVAPRPMVGALVEALRAMQKEHALAGEVTISDVARFPGTLDVMDDAGPVTDAVAAEVVLLVEKALGELDAMRRAEGAHLGAELASVLSAIAGGADRVASLTESGQESRREALAEKLRTLVHDLGLEDGRLYQEVVRAVDKHDVAEEVQRLRSHVVQAEQALAGEAPCGKRLDFLAQEMGREANTVGSKAASAGVIQEVVALKTAIERLREQVQNVE